MNRHDSESLRRIVFGRDATAEERAAAEAALRQLDEAELAAVSDTEQIRDEDHSKADTSAAHDSDVEANEESPSFWRRSIRVAWLVPIVAGSIAIGYAASIGPLESMSGTPISTATQTPSAEPTDEPTSGRRPGDLAAADSWFDRAYKETDTFPDAVALEQFGIAAEDMRIAINGGDKGSVWVARAGDALCLVISDPVDGVSASSCTERDRFAESGIALGSNNLGASWYGREVTTSPPLIPAATGPLPPTTGPGDLAAANSRFILPALPSDEYSEPDMLANLHISQSDVRRIIPESTPWIRLWLAKQGTAGFCFLSVDEADASSQAACALIDEFTKSGLAMTTQGYSFFWDGTSVSVTGP